MGSFFYYNALGQEKTGDFWVNGKLFGKQSCHITENIEHAEPIQAVTFAGDSRSDRGSSARPRGGG
jgi:hypothetical protein